MTSSKAWLVLAFVLGLLGPISFIVFHIWPSLAFMWPITVLFVVGSLLAWFACGSEIFK